MSCRNRLLQNLLPRRDGIPSSPYCAKGRSFALLVKQPLSRADIATIARGTACKLLRVAEQPYRRQYVRTCAADENHDQFGAGLIGRDLDFLAACCAADDEAVFQKSVFAAALIELRQQSVVLL